MKEKWPKLSYEKGKASYETLHMWTQILGKLKLESLPWKNHSWHVALHFTPTGFTTGNMPYKNINFQINLDLIRHRLVLITSRGDVRDFELPGLSVSQFYQKLFGALKELGIKINIYAKPVEILNPVAFEKDQERNTYDLEQITRFHRAMLSVDEVLTSFRCDFKGKSSDVHFFWGSFDLAVSRFSGKRAPKHPGGIPNIAKWVIEEAYSHEVMSAGFWPGSESFPEAAFYCYLYPEPEGYKNAGILPKEAYYHKTLGEFVLPYKAVQQSGEPGRMLRNFLNSTYEVGTALGNWDRESLEK